MPASDIRPETPDYLLRILDRCVEIDKNLRYESLREVLKDVGENRVRTTMTYAVRRRSRYLSCRD